MGEGPIPFGLQEELHHVSPLSEVVFIQWRDVGLEFVISSSEAGDGGWEAGRAWWCPHRWVLSVAECRTSGVRSRHPEWCDGGSSEGTS